MNNRQGPGAHSEHELACDWHYDSLNQALVDTGVPPISRKDHLHTYNGLPTKVKLQMLGLTGELAALIWELKQKYTNKIIESSALVSCINNLKTFNYEIGI